MDRVYNWISSILFYNKENTTNYKHNIQQDLLESQIDINIMQLEKTPEYSYPISFSKACVL